MKKVKGKIILVDDDADELDFLKEALKAKNWDIEIEFFTNVDDALEHLKVNADEIFLIISDMDMPGKNGMDFKKIVDDDEYLSQKAIPFVFISHSLIRSKVITAYKLRVQGFFQKPMTSAGQAEMFEVIIQYWIMCVHPNKDDLPENPNL